MLYENSHLKENPAALYPENCLGALSAPSFARIQQVQQKKPVIIEMVRYQDPIRRQRPVPRIHALSELVSSGNIGQGLRLPPFHGLHEDRDNTCFNIVYGCPRNNLDNTDRIDTISPQDLLL